ncbi:hypothetical protein [Desulfosporosinus sp. OT]|nr:hypothetical protein [Desulfosporosinus sp. OT]EGW41818.1 hypothetical protein DOT_0236 [Desulfosporosinus sp. OT]
MKQYIIVGNFIVEDEKKQRIQLSSKGSTTGESLAVYEPLALPEESLA